MNSSHSSELALLAAVLVLLAGAAVAGAVTVDSANAPEESAVGDEVTVEASLTNLYAESSSWTLGGSTELEDATWTIEAYQDGTSSGTNTVDGSELPTTELDENADQSYDRIDVSVTGTVPQVGNYAAEEPDQFLGMELARNDEAIDSWTVDQYAEGDPGSRAARTALDDARAAIDQASSDGDDVSAAESTWEDGVAAYDEGDWGEAVSMAEEAESQLEDDGSAGANDDSDDGGNSDGDGDGASEGGTDGASDDGTDESADDGSNDDGGIGALTLFFYALGIAVLVGVVGGAIYLHQQRQGPGRDPLG